jgi:hypothetical protein
MILLKETEMMFVSRVIEAAWKGLEEFNEKGWI